MFRTRTVQPTEVTAKETLSPTAFDSTGSVTAPAPETNIGKAGVVSRSVRPSSGRPGISPEELAEALSIIGRRRGNSVDGTLDLAETLTELAIPVTAQEVWEEIQRQRVKTARHPL